MISITIEELKNKPFVISIGRQYGSAGRAIGKLLAHEFRIEYFDRELITHAATESGLAPEYFERADEIAPKGLLGALSATLAMSGGASGSQCPLSRESIFQIQADVIRDLVATRSCVIVGRCADYILRDNPRMISVFIDAPLEERISRTMIHESLSAQAAEEQCRKNDKRRKSYYDFYTDRTWGEAASYHLTIDSSKLGIEPTAIFIKNYIIQRLASSK